MSDPTSDDPSQHHRSHWSRSRSGSSRLQPCPPRDLLCRPRAEVEQVRALLRRAEVRLLTLTGPGGVGKTRLALRVAAELASTFPDGIVFVPLTPIRDPDQVLPAIARAIGIREGGDRPLAARLAMSLRDRTILLVLDNLEQVPDAARIWPTSWRSCPFLTILATSRVVLRVSGERDVPVPPLSLSRETRDVRRENEDLTHGSRLTSRVSEAVALFAERAQAADWQVFMRHSSATLAHLGVPDRETGEVLAFFDSLTDDVIEA